MSLLKKLKKAHRINILDAIDQADDLYDLFKYACENEYIDMIELIYNKQINFNDITKFKRISCMHGTLNTLKCLHKLQPILEDEQTTLFMIASANNELKIVKWLSELPDFNYKNFKYGLARAKANNRKKVISWILTEYPLIEM